MSSKPKALLSWSLYVECPECGHDFDASELDYTNENTLANLVFSNRWGDADGHELTCPKCNHEFEIGGIDY